MLLWESNGAESMMKIVLMIISVSVVLSSCSGTSDTSVPEVISQGFEMYQRKGAEDAINTWGASWSEEYAHSKTVLRNSLLENEKSFGKFTGYEVVRTVAIGKSFRHHYITLRYETSPVFALFTTYLDSKGNWVVLYIGWNSEMKEIYPEKLYLP